MSLCFHRFIALASVFTFAFAGPAFARRPPLNQNSDADTVIVDSEYARTETYRYPSLQVFLMVTKEGSKLNLSIHCTYQAIAVAAPTAKDFKLQVFDDRHEEVPCKVDISSTGSAPNFTSLGYAMAPKPGHIPTTASVWFQGYEHIFTFKLKANEPIK